MCKGSVTIVVLNLYTCFYRNFIVICIFTSRLQCHTNNPLYNTSEQLFVSKALENCVIQAQHTCSLPSNTASPVEGWLDGWPA